MMKPCQLYRHFDADGRLLYVGISKHGLKRLAQHAGTAPWASLVARIDMKEYPSRKAARNAERFAIATEAPMFNFQEMTGMESAATTGRRLRFTLDEAYQMARRGDLIHTIDPVEFAKMTDQEKREHRRALKRLAATASGGVSAP